MKKKINLILIAMQEELNVLLTMLPPFKKVDTDLGELIFFNIKEEEYLLMLGRIGKVSTALILGRLYERYEIKRIFNMGTAGSLIKSINIGDIVIASEVIYHDVDVVGFNYDYGQVPGNPQIFIPDEEYISSHLKGSYDSFKIHKGRVISGDSFLTKDNINRIPSFILEKAICGEMEAGAISQVGYNLNIPVIIIRTISDYIYAPSNGIDMDKNLKRACINGSRVLLDLITS